MSAISAKRGRVAVIGAGPAGMATALSVHQAGHDVILLERYHQARPAGNILNLWPPPIKALGLLGVDINDLGAPCYSEFRSAAGRTRVRVDLPDDVVKAYGGGFIGLLRPELYERLLAALPPGILQVDRTVDSFDEDETGVRLHMAGGEIIEADVLVGADGIDSLVRRTLWGDAPKREHNLHIFGGFTFDDDRACREGAGHHFPQPDRAGQLDLYPQPGPRRLSVVGARRPRRRHRVHRRPARHRDEDGRRVRRSVAAAHRRHRPRQRAALGTARPQAGQAWSKGRATLVGDAAHPTSPYAAYGAGMATEDGYFLGRQLAGVDLSDYTAVRAALDAFEAPRKPHTARQVQQAYILGKVFHHAPAPLRAVRDAILDRTPFLQKVVGESSPGEILAQISAINEAEQRFAAVRGSDAE